MKKINEERVNELWKDWKDIHSKLNDCGFCNWCFECKQLQKISNEIASEVNEY